MTHPANKIDKTINNGSGFTLAEILVAMLIILSIFLFAISVFPTGARLMEKNTHILTASSTANNVLEINRHKNFNDIADYDGNTIYSGNLNGKSYVREFLYNVDVDSMNAKLKKVSVTVYWKEDGKNRYLLIQTLVFKKD